MCILDKPYTCYQPDKGVCHFKKEGKKNEIIHSPSQALNLILIVILSPNRYTTSNFGRPCTQFRLIYTMPLYILDTHI